MFTRIATATVSITNVETKADLRVVLSCPRDPAAMGIGDSIVCSGFCLTVVENFCAPRQTRIPALLSADSLSRSS